MLEKGIAMGILTTSLFASSGPNTIGVGYHNIGRDCHSASHPDLVQKIEDRYHLNISGQDKPTIWWKPCCADRDGYDGQRVERISFHLTARQEAVN